MKKLLMAGALAALVPFSASATDFIIRLYQPGLPETVPAPQFTVFTSNVIGTTHTFFVKPDGSLYAAGNNGRGQLGLGNTVSRSSPTLVPTVSNVQSALAWANQSAVLTTNSTLYGAGQNGASFPRTYGTLSPNNLTMAPVPNGAGVTDYGFAQLGGTSIAMWAVRPDGLYASGTDTFGRFGNGPTGNAQFDGLTRVTAAPSNVEEAKLSQNASYVRLSDNSVVGIGANGMGQLGQGDRTARTTFVSVTTGAAELAVGNMGFIKKLDGSLYQLGGANGSGGYFTTPTLKATDVAEFAVTPYNSYLLVRKNDNTLWYADSYSNYVLTQVLSDVVAIQAGYNVFYALKADGTVFEGTRNFAQVADETRAIVAGAETIFITKWDGTIWAKGDNSYGQLGVGDTQYKSAWTQVTLP